jgi:hypothetical protein
MLSIGIYKRGEKSWILFRKAVSLQKSFDTEFFFPSNERLLPSVKDKIVSLLPDLPSCYDKDLHKEWWTVQVPGLLKGCKAVNLVVPLNIQMSLTVLAKRAIEEQIEGNFFSLKLTKSSTVVVALNLKVLSL